MKIRPQTIALHASAVTLALALSCTGGPSLAGAQTAPAAPADSGLKVTFFGEVRSRSEWEHPAGATPADLFTYLRSRLGARAALAGGGTRLVVSLQDSRVLGAEGTPGAQVLDLHEGYLELAPAWPRAALVLRAGRQEVALGNERLVGRVNWSNTGRSFDGLRATLAPRAPNAGWTATAFAATVEERGRRFGTRATADTAPAPDQAVGGLFASHALGAGGAVEGTLLHDRGMRARGREVAGRTTADARLRTPRVRGLGVELEGAYQAGRQRRLTTVAGTDGRETIGAWLLGARAGTAPAARSGAGARPLGVTLGADLLSGDTDPADGRDGAFSTLYATNHPFYGLMDVVGDPAASTGGRGLGDLFASTTAAPAAWAALRADVHHLTGPRGGRAYGWETDLVTTVKLVPAASLELGYGAFRPDAAGTALGMGRAGTTRQWGYAQITAGF